MKAPESYAQHKLGAGNQGFGGTFLSPSLPVTSRRLILTQTIWDLGSSTNLTFKYAGIFYLAIDHRP
jgi:hypothetical protein